MQCAVNLVWDSEASIWYTQTDDIPGLVLHSPSFDELIKRVRLAAPELVEENLNYVGPLHISFGAERIEEGIDGSREGIAV